MRSLNLKKMKEIWAIARGLILDGQFNLAALHFICSWYLV